MSPREPQVVAPIRGPLDARVWVPGSKSLTNRALVCAALADGTSTLEGALLADDTEAMIDCLRALGVAVRVDGDRDGPPATIEVVGGPIHSGDAVLDARLSGTTSRFVLPMLVHGQGPRVVDGAAPLRVRPMADLVGALRVLGAEVEELGEQGHLPIRVTPPATIRTNEVDVRGDASSQFLSGLLLSAPRLPEGLVVHIDGELVSRPYVDMTLAVMRSFGATATWDGATISVAPGGYTSTTYAIEPDASAASYPLAAAAICGGAVHVAGLGADALQGDARFAELLERMGASVERDRDGTTVRSDRSLRGIDVDMTDLSDTAQTLAAVAVFADAPTTIQGIGFIRRKETDRLAATVTELTRCGIDATELDDGLRVVPGEPQPAVVETYDDHRVAMSFALLGLRADGIAIADPDVVDKTYPGFWRMLESLSSGGNAT